MIKRALGTVTAYKSLNSLINGDNREPSSEIQSQASRLTDSTPSSASNQENKTNNGLSKSKGRPKKESAQVATKTSLDADFINDETKPLTRSRAREIARSTENISDPQSTSNEIISQREAPGGSRLLIKRLKY